MRRGKKESEIRYFSSCLPLCVGERRDTFYDVIVCTGQRRHNNNQWWGDRIKEQRVWSKKTYPFQRDRRRLRETWRKQTKYYQSEGKKLEGKTNKEDRETRESGE